MVDKIIYPFSKKCATIEQGEFTMTKIILSGRTDLKGYFEISGVFTASKLNHTPFLVFITSDDTVQVRIVPNSKELLTYPDDTPVMGQWSGNWSSDFFQFFVGDYRNFLEEKVNTKH